MYNWKGNSRIELRRWSALFRARDKFGYYCRLCGISGTPMFTALLTCTALPYQSDLGTIIQYILHEKGRSLLREKIRVMGYVLWDSSPKLPIQMYFFVLVPVLQSTFFFFLNFTCTAVQVSDTGYGQVMCHAPFKIKPSIEGVLGCNFPLGPKCVSGYWHPRGCTNGLQRKK